MNYLNKTIKYELTRALMLVVGAFSLLLLLLKLLLLLLLLLLNRLRALRENTFIFLLEQQMTTTFNIRSEEGSLFQILV
jgi:hypothetical protein